MLLADFVSHVYLPSRVSLTSDYATKIHAIVRRFSVSIGHPARMGDLTANAIAGYCSAYSRQWSSRTTNDQRQILLMLWRSAVAHHVLDRPPEPELIRILPVQQDPPVAWTLEHLQKLPPQCDKQPGLVGDIPASLFWRALFATTYWTGCRIGALIATPSACYEAGVGLLVRRQKNKQPDWYPLPPACCKELDATYPADHEMLFPWPHCRRHLFTVARRIIEAAGLPAPKTGRQLFHRMRRTTLSLCAAVDPAIAQRQAGHSDYRTTQRHYIDPRIARGRCAADILPDPASPSESKPRFRVVG